MERAGTSGHHTCVLKANGNVDCYGDDSSGQANDYTGGDAIGVFGFFIKIRNKNQN